jgi:hypothetical protein
VTGKPSEPFLTRWSRRKREETDAAEQVAAAPSPQPSQTAALGPPAPARPEAAADSILDDQLAGEQPGDLEAPLPSIDTITAGSDIRAFLRAGVPAELTKAALRRAWTSDPAIRDFIGLAENQWDFTDPSAIPGFGPLGDDEQVSSLVRQALGQALPPPPAAEPAATADTTPEGREPAVVQVHGMPDRNEDDGGDSRAVEGQQNVALAAAQHPAAPAVPVRPSSRRTHGSARPK